MLLEAIGITDVGRCREANEDNYFISAVAPVIAVADGMGGHASGEVASALVVSTFARFYDGEGLTAEVTSALRDQLPWPWKQREPDHVQERRLVQTIMLSNRLIHSHATANEHCQGMGTTVVGAYFVQGGLYLSHVGDSRGYRFRNGKLTRITRDHSLADEYYQLGLLDDEALAAFPYGNVVTRAVGLAADVEPDIRFYDTELGDVYLLCSDGLTDPVTDAMLQTLMLDYSHDLAACAKLMIEAANNNGGPDNITVILARVTDADKD